MNRQHWLVVVACIVAALGWLAVLMRNDGSRAQEPVGISREEIQAARRGDSPAKAAEVGQHLVPSRSANAELVQAVSQENIKERDPGEWIGMPVDLNKSPPCEKTEDCQMARACVSGACTACGADSECLSGEVCVLDHCVKSELASCRTRAECNASAVCVLTGYSDDTRGNQRMRAICSNELDTAKRSTRPSIAAGTDERRLASDGDMERARALMRGAENAQQGRSK